MQAIDKKSGQRIFLFKIVKAAATLQLSFLELRPNMIHLLQKCIIELYANSMLSNKKVWPLVFTTLRRLFIYKKKSETLLSISGKLLKLSNVTKLLTLTFLQVLGHTLCFMRSIRNLRRHTILEISSGN